MVCCGNIIRLTTVMLVGLALVLRCSEGPLHNVWKWRTIFSKWRTITCHSQISQDRHHGAVCTWRGWHFPGVHQVQRVYEEPRWKVLCPAWIHLHCRLLGLCCSLVGNCLVCSPFQRRITILYINRTGPLLTSSFVMMNWVFEKLETIMWQ